MADALSSFYGKDVIVLALPRGGVPIGKEIAEALGGELDVLIVRKLGAPGNPEFGFGAIASGGVQYIDVRTVRMLNLSEREIKNILEQERKVLQCRSKMYRADRPEPCITGRTVILVDDGLATGSTAHAAIRAVRQAKPQQLVLAVPVAPVETVNSLRSEVDDLVCLACPPLFKAVGQWYQRFEQITDQEVIDLLRSCYERGKNHGHR